MNDPIEKAMGRLVAACPSFVDEYRAYIADTYDLNEPRLLYVDVSELVRHVIKLHRRGESEVLAAVFTEVEALHHAEESAVREFATIGFLESLQNLAPSPQEFQLYLGTESRVWWHRLDRFWDGDTTALKE